MTPAANPGPVTVTVYRVTGRQFFIRIAKSLCEECDLTVSTAIKAIRELDGIESRLVVRPWLEYLPLALMQGALHPPVLLVNGEVVSQGFVPTVEGVKTAIVLAAQNGHPKNLETFHPRDATSRAIPEIGMGCFA